jgi:hypothetical protein
MKNYYFRFEGKTHERIKSILFWTLLVFFGAFIYAYIHACSDKHSDTIKYLNDALVYSFIIIIPIGFIKYFEIKYIKRKEKEKADSKGLN